MIHKRNYREFLRYTMLTGILCFIASSTGCALLGSGNITVPHASGYHVVAPHHWRKLDQPESDQAYRLPSGDIVTLNSSCSPETSKHPLESLSRDLLLGGRNVTYQDHKTLMVDGSEGLYSAVTLTMEKVPFQMRTFVLPKGGCVFDFSLISRNPIAESETAEFLAYVMSFKYGKSN